jgi:hypothetical protein
MVEAILGAWESDMEEEERQEGEEGEEREGGRLPVAVMMPLFCGRSRRPGNAVSMKQSRPEM